MSLLILSRMCESEPCVAVITVAKYPTTTILKYSHGHCRKTYAAYPSLLLAQFFCFFKCVDSLLETLDCCLEILNSLEHCYCIAFKNDFLQILFVVCVDCKLRGCSNNFLASSDQNLVAFAGTLSSKGILLMS